MSGTDRALWMPMATESATLQVIRLVPAQGIRWDNRQKAVTPMDPAMQLETRETDPKTAPDTVLNPGNALALKMVPKPAWVRGAGRTPGMRESEIEPAGEAGDSLQVDL